MAKKVIKKKQKTTDIPKGENPLEGKMLTEEKTPTSLQQTPHGVLPQNFINPQSLAEMSVLTNMLTRTSNQLQAALQQLERVVKENNELKAKIGGTASPKK